MEQEGKKGMPWKSIWSRRKNATTIVELEELKAEIESLRERIRKQETLSRENRFLELEARGDAYVRVCGRLAPHIRVDDAYEPKVLVRIQHDSAEVLTDRYGEYFSLVPSDGRTDGDRWVADASLSACVSDLHGKSEATLRLGIVGVDGREQSWVVEWRRIDLIYRAADDYRAIFTVERDEHSVRLGDHMNAIVAALTIGPAAASYASKNILVPRTTRREEG
ncbi:MAG: hypothetical protein OXR82_00540 [Gammaproteobacteria bacterium]|nr:hypothetical protein [Gammaproteobacteria bacterium]